MRKYIFTIITLIYIFNLSFAQIPTNGLVGFWPFNGNANDESGNGNNGGVFGAALSTDRFGNPNKAYSLDGINDYILVPDNSSLNFANSHTICAWFNTINPVVGSEVSGTIVGKAKTVNLRSYIIYISGATGMGDSLLYYLFKTNDALYKSNIYTLPYYDNKWHMITTTYDYSTGNMKVYIDSLLKKTTQIGQISLEQTTTPLTFGCIHGVSSGYRYFFHGFLDDICIYNRTLTDTEILQVYHQNFVKINETPLSNKNIFIFPNPANKNKTIKISGILLENVNYTLYDITGKIIVNKELINSNDSFDIDTDDICSGIYFLKVVQKKSLQTVKLIVE